MGGQWRQRRTGERRGQHRLVLQAQHLPDLERGTAHLPRSARLSSRPPGAQCGAAGPAHPAELSRQQLRVLRVGKHPTTTAAAHRPPRYLGRRAGRQADRQPGEARGSASPRIRAAPVGVSRHITRQALRGCSSVADGPGESVGWDGGLGVRRPRRVVLCRRVEVGRALPLRLHREGEVIRLRCAGECVQCEGAGVGTKEGGPAPFWSEGCSSTDFRTSCRCTLATARPPNTSARRRRRWGGCSIGAARAHAAREHRVAETRAFRVSSGDSIASAVQSPCH
eukprot:SAG11_NODE_5138_length_1654_cov_3.866881_1_plen_281_part_00